ncbi:hypothetical protein [uncultured Dokdonia sp.]|uniref:hypothetical protein n=1 Tax=uncultured Dokdonia sp. TaxID=575653 RepID=UPI002625584A|nr:hypothetical protein [uncultured Dokdonia sp.]
MNRLTLLLLSIVLISCNNTEKKEQLPEKKEVVQPTIKSIEEVKSKIKRFNDFIPSDYELVISRNELNKVMSDFNKDGVSDYAVLLASGKNDRDYSNTKDVRLAIFEGQADGSFVLKSQTGNLTSAFLHVNPNRRIKVARANVISVKHESMRHDYELQIKYDKTYNDYMLIGSEYNNYGNASKDGAGNISSNFIEGKRVSTIGKNKTTTLDKKLLPISAINDGNIYELIGG